MKFRAPSGFNERLRARGNFKLGEAGDFKAEVYDGRTLLVATDVKQMCMYFGIRQPDALLVFINSYPETVAEHLHWSIEDLKNAKQKLVDVLRGHSIVTAELLDAPLCQAKE